MEITHLGHSCFKLRGRIATLITDPFDPEMLGIKFPKSESDVVTVSHRHPDHDFTDGIEGEKVIVTGPGEYEIKGVSILGIVTYHDNSKGSKSGKNTVYKIVMDGITIVHCGDLGHKLEDSQKEVLTGCDVLLIPVGGTYTINHEEACEIVTQLEPRIVIPMHYKSVNLKNELNDNLADLSLFLKEMGKEGIQPQPKLNITKDKLPTEPIIIVLE